MIPQLLIHQITTMVGKYLHCMWYASYMTWARGFSINGCGQF